MNHGSGLRRLARLSGINTTYLDVWNRRRVVSDDALRRTLELLGVDAGGPGGVTDALRRRRLERWQTPLEPVCVVWGDAPLRLRLRWPAATLDSPFHCRIEWESGGDAEFSGRLAELPLMQRRQVEGVQYVALALTVPMPLPLGYHRLRLTVRDRCAESLVIVAPLRAYVPPPGAADRLWGVFLPLYALHRQGVSMAGNFTDLEALMHWTAAQGGRLVATLPLLTTLWEISDDPSPYSPASRLFWNELYLDPRRIAEFASCTAAQVLYGDAVEEASRQAAAIPAGKRLIDYGGEVGVRRQVLERLCDAFFTGPAERRRQLEQFCRDHPEVEAFARFRAVGERQEQGWPAWPEPLRSGVIRPGDYDEHACRYYLFTQWQLEMQLEALAADARQRDLLWYLDFPLGVGGAGYDVWREPELFVREASGGAPPDSFFTKGQNWGFPPLHPQRLRAQGYRYLIAALRRHLKYAKVLRFDHAMGLYRLYWIPHGMDAADGAYVRYATEELFAILVLESHRHEAQIVGENLGTVPPPVNEAMARHGIRDMYVLQYEMNPERVEPLRPVPPTAVASVNTHDMPQFAAYWQGIDIDDRRDLGLLDAAETEEEHRNRQARRQLLLRVLRQQGFLAPKADDLESVLEAALAWLAAGRAPIALVNLEDLWQEIQPQNTPGTFRERPNWRRPARLSFEQFAASPAVRRLLGAVDRHRRAALPSRADEGAGSG